MKTLARGLRFIWKLIVALLLGRKAPEEKLEQAEPRPQLEDPSERTVTDSRGAETLVSA